MDIKDFIRIAAIKKKLTVEKLAELSNQSSSNLYNKLSRNDMKVSELERLAAALDCRLSVSFIDNSTDKPL